MKTIGLLAGMSWVSTQLYYRVINEGVAARLGASHSAKLVMHSFDFAEIETMQERGDWSAAGRLLGEAAYALGNAGADFMLICANTMHRVADDVERIGGRPVLHIGEATAEALAARGITKAALLGTKYTMELPFLRERLERRGIAVLLPSDAARERVHAIIYSELIRNTFTDASRAEYAGIIERLAAQGAQAVVMGCTEIGLLLRPGDVALPLFDTAQLHAQSAVDRALS